MELQLRGQLMAEPQVARQQKQRTHRRGQPHIPHMGLQQQAQRQKQPGLQQIGRTLQLFRQVDALRDKRSSIERRAQQREQIPHQHDKKQQFHICRPLLRNLQHPVQPDDCHRTSRQQDTR